MDQDSSGSSDRERQVNKIITTYLEAVDAGQRPDRHEWLRQYPEFAAELEAFLAEYAWVDRLAEPLPPAAADGIPAPPESVVPGEAATIDSRQPILAQPVGQPKVAQRWRGLNPILAGLTLLVLVSVVIGAVVTACLVLCEQQWADKKKAAGRAETHAKYPADAAKMLASEKAREAESRTAAGAERLPGTGAAPEKPSPAAERPASQPAVHLPVVSSLVGADGKWKLPPGAPPPAVAPFDSKKAREHQEAWAKHVGVPVELTNSIGMKLKFIPPGEFMMGSPKELIEEELRLRGDDAYYRDHLPGEGPQHRVRITKPYWLGATDVTQEEYQRLMGSNPSRFQGDAKRPVEQVSWDDAVEFCRRLSELPGEKAAQRRYELPTEAQWEHACRAGTTTRWYSGDDETELVDVAWFDKNVGGMTHPVGQKKPNAWGLFDMNGNVWQWCQDWHYGGYYLYSPTDDPTGPATGSGRVLRGGDWNYPARYCRSASRYRDGPVGGRDSLGLRVSRVPAVVPDGETNSSPKELRVDLKEPQPSEQGKARQTAGTDSKTESPPKELTVDLGKGIKLEMVLIPVDEFMMDSPEPDSTVAFSRPLATVCNFGSPNGSRCI